MYLHIYEEIGFSPIPTPDTSWHFCPFVFFFFTEVIFGLLSAQQLDNLTNDQSILSLLCIPCKVKYLWKER